MKLRFNTYDIVCGVTELQNLIGLRVNQVYDIDNKTYLIRLQGGEHKTILLIESGVRFHTTAFEWPKNVAPSGFSMKLRKHLKNKRLEKLQQLGADRIVDFQFGFGEAAYHVIAELYDRGNIILTDHEFTILYILRPHNEGEDLRLAVREKYPLERAKQEKALPNKEQLRGIIKEAEGGNSLRYILMDLVECGPTVIDHVLMKHALDNCIMRPKHIDTEPAGTGINEEAQNKTKKKNKREAKAKPDCRLFEPERDLDAVMAALEEAFEMLVKARNLVSQGYIIQKKQEKSAVYDSTKLEHFYQNIEYQPYLFRQYEGQPAATFDSFMLAVDEFYSTLGGQKIDMKTLQQEREALKKLSNVKKDHAKRLEELNKAQENDKRKAELISCNQALVDNAILAIRSAIANQMSWPDIQELVKAAQANGDPVAGSINQLKLEINHISLKLSDPYAVCGGGSDDFEDIGSKEENDVVTVDVDLGVSAWANARKYYELKRSAAQKEQKTVDASQKALKSAERKTQQTLKEVRTISSISKARKVYWFEKFYWFISSENYLVIGGRDAQQNELIVKRYMRPTDIYVHAEIQGAASVIVRNPTGGEVPPKTLLEAGTMAISYSVAWDAKVVTNAYWVHSDQVSKTAPTGEFLGTGSFMIRGRKNFLPSCHLIMGLSLLFKLEESFVEKHRGERKVRSFEEEQQNEEKRTYSIENERLESICEEEAELNVEDSDNEGTRISETTRTPKSSISEKNEEEEHKSSGDDNSVKDAFEFPDTQVKIEHDTGKIIIEKQKEIESELTQTNSSFKNLNISVQLFAENEETTIISSIPTRKKRQQNAKKRKEEKAHNSRKNQNQQQQVSLTVNASAKNAIQLKRGQKGKLKKMKAKYKDQDEEERQRRMQILKSAGNVSTTEADVKFDEKNGPTKELNKVKRQVETKAPTDAEGEEADDALTGADVEMLDSLSGIPFEEDELLFCIPVVAPYQALQNYKYKVKLTPGTGKRGRAAKTAITLFSKDKLCTAREKDLLKSIKEEALARNIPGKVKLSAPQLQKYRK
uniref:NFACT RNA-binding domain-containing protein n=1 Tax=Glossina brevipalpis TaxID=37001 RepID=A0A1A9W2Q3_9MUSC